MNQQDTAEHVAERIHAVQTLVKTDRNLALSRLNEIFRAGTPPAPLLNGRYAGKLIALNIAPGLTQFTEMVAAAWMPWQGKTFNAARSTGDNIFHRSSYLLAHIFWPLYRGCVADTSATYRAFPFRTYLAPGRENPDRQVLKIDYDIPGNPALSIRHVLDELVQVGDGYYLGQAHLKWWWGRWQLVAYFALESVGQT
jgi:hypothetical protein